MTSRGTSDWSRSTWLAAAALFPTTDAALTVARAGALDGAVEAAVGAAVGLSGPAAAPRSPSATASRASTTVMTRTARCWPREVAPGADPPPYPFGPAGRVSSGRVTVG